jgi:ABC-2 type transport system ATP-binding protein
VLAVRAIDKAFGDRKALAGVTLDVAAGEVVLLVGRNGAGKTTLLRIITGFLDPDAGEVAIGGIDVATARVKAQAKLGYLPEHAPAPVEPIVRDHLYLRARLKGCRDPAAAVARAAKAAAIESELERTIGTLSKGYRQRVGLADALLGEPPLLVLDEPTSGLDPLQVTEMREHIAAIVSESRRAALVSSHAVSDLEPLATRVAVLREGVLVAFDTPAKMREKAGAERLETAVVKLLGETVKLGDSR